MDCHRRAAYPDPGMTHPDDNKDRERQDALKELDRLRQGGETFLGATTGMARRVGDHLAGKDAEPSDRIEVWGRRIGRILGVLAVIALAFHLYFTYVR